jgi:hypothetical protein
MGGLRRATGTDNGPRWFDGPFANARIGRAIRKEIAFSDLGNWLLR